jgi:hypothetical protein
VLTEYDSRFPEIGPHLTTIHAEGLGCTACDASSIGKPTGLERQLHVPFGALPRSPVAHEGHEGELYNPAADPREYSNPWDDPARRARRDRLARELREGPPKRREPWPLVEARA